MSTAREYFKGQSQVLESRYRASFIKGNMADTGSNRESIFSDWLTQHLPKATSPEIGGQIMDSYGQISGQIDLVLYNDNAPRFGGHPKSYFFAEGVISAIQVKSKLTRKELYSALKNLQTVKNCKLSASSGLIVGKPSESILTGIFAYDIDLKDFPKLDSITRALSNAETRGVKTVDFLCINGKVYIAHNKGEWEGKKADGSKLPLPLGYVIVDNSIESIFRMVLALSAESTKNIATTVDFQPYFLINTE